MVVGIVLLGPQHNVSKCISVLQGVHGKQWYDLSRLEIKKVTGEIEITGGKNLLLTVDELKL